MGLIHCDLVEQYWIRHGPTGCYQFLVEANSVEVSRTRLDYVASSYDTHLSPNYPSLFLLIFLLQLPSATITFFCIYCGFFHSLEPMWPEHAYYKLFLNSHVHVQYSNDETQCFSLGINHPNLLFYA